MSCPFLKPHSCAGCDDAWRCDGATPPFVIEDNLAFCFEENYKECPHYLAGIEVRALAREIKLVELKKELLAETGMEQLEGILNQEPDDIKRLEKLKELYRSQLKTLYEYKAELGRLKGNKKWKWTRKT